MTVGDKIRKYRTMNNLTQKELGIKVGFSPATADSRIRKYEKDFMAPKEDLRRKIADALDVDISALSDINIRSYEDVMQVLFLFEEEFGMQIERTKDVTSLVFDNHNKDISTLISYLYTWYTQKKDAEDTDGLIKEDSSGRYHHWKARFPKDINKYWNEQLDKIHAHYKPIVDKLRKTQHPIINLSDFVRQIRSMIQCGITLESGVKLFGVGDSGLLLGFFTTEIIQPTDKNAENSFAKFLYNLKTMQGYGMPVDISLLTKENGTQIIYCLRLSTLTSFQSTIDKVQRFERNRENNNDWDVEMFESLYEDEIATHDINLEDEIKLYYSDQTSK